MLKSELHLTGPSEQVIVAVADAFGVHRQEVIDTIIKCGFVQIIERGFAACAETVRVEQAGYYRPDSQAVTCHANIEAFLTAMREIADHRKEVVH